MEHRLVNHEDCPDPGHCAVCDGGLAVCTVCGGAEGELPSECPGAPMTEKQMEEVYAGRLNFIRGEWIARGGRGDLYEGLFLEWEDQERRVRDLRWIIQNPASVSQADLDHWKDKIEKASSDFDTLVEKTYHAIVGSNRGLK